MLNSGFEARIMQPCHSTNMDLHFLLNSLNHAKNDLLHQEMLRKLCHPDPAAFHVGVNRQKRLYQMMPYELEGIDLINFQENFLLKADRSIIETKAEEATTTPSLTPKVEVDTEDPYSGQILSNNCKEEEGDVAAEGSSHQQTKRRFWLPAEDAKLIELVSLHGEKWSKIATLMQGRTGKQIRDRYINSLKPGIRQEAWTKEEDELLIKLYLKIGNKWSKIAHFLKGRTENQVKNRFRTFFKRGSLNFQTDDGQVVEEEEEEHSKPKKYIKKEPSNHQCACHQPQPLNYQYYHQDDAKMYINFMQARNNAIWNEYIMNSKHLHELLLTKQEYEESISILKQEY